VPPHPVTPPTEAKLRYKAIVKLGKAAKLNAIDLRQSYVRVGKLALIKSGRYRHAKQMKRAKKQEKYLKTRLGRLIRDVERKSGKLPEEKIILLKEVLQKAEQIYRQKVGDADYLYSWHCPEVECIGKGKAHKPYEFGNNVSFMTNVNPAPGGHFILHAKSFHGKPYDGHTLKTVLEEKKYQTGIPCERTYVDKGYRGHKIKGFTRVYQSGQKRGVTKAIKKELKRRSVIEPIIGHAKQDSRMDRNYLHGELGDKVNAVMAAIGFNFRRLLAWFRQLFWPLYFWFIARRLSCVQMLLAVKPGF
jgi:IS5 family transposase